MPVTAKAFVPPLYERMEEQAYVSRIRRPSARRISQAATVRYSVDFISGVISAAELETRHADWALETLNSSASEMAAPYAGSPYEPPRPSVEITSVMDNVDLFGGDLSELRDVDSVEMCVSACVQARTHAL
eukprot:4572503-Pleurochrysis_carterae.AAC.1